jgi:hypothetical protein
MRTHRQTGQAAAEGIGITVVLALLVAATAAWLLNATHPPGRPPDVIGRVAQPLGGAYDPRLWRAPALPPFLDALAQGGRAAPIGRVLRAAGNGALTGVVVAVQARNQFIEGMAERFQERTVDFLRHPLGEAGALPDPDSFTLRAIGLAAAERAGEIWDYARFLRTLPVRTAILTASRDAGRATADILVQVAQSALRRRVLRGRSGPPPPPPPPPTRAPVPAPAP